MSDMKYIVFWGDRYYPSGGWTDNHKFTDSLDEAKGICAGVVLADDLKWAHVVDVAEDKVILKQEGVST